MDDVIPVVPVMEGSLSPPAPFPTIARDRSRGPRPLSALLVAQLGKSGKKRDRSHKSEKSECSLQRGHAKSKKDSSARERGGRGWEVDVAFVVVVATRRGAAGRG